MSQPAVPAGPEPTPTEHIAVLLQHAQFPLPEAYLPDLIRAYGYVQRLTSRIHRGYRRDEEPAHVFNARAFEPRAEASHV